MFYNGRSMLKNLDAAGYGPAHMCLGKWFTNGIGGLKLDGLIFLRTNEKEGNKKWIPCEKVTTE